jgi:multiphosphoryl transfer protein
VRVLANVGSLDEAERAPNRGADGCGLLRSEFLYLDRREAPDEAMQAREYAAFASAFGELPLTIRTLDAGGDKPIAYLPLPREDNPALGLRGLRTGLRHPELLNTQLRALLRAGRAQQIRILLPMVNEPAELAQVRAMLDACAGDLGLDRVPELGVMIETPASALLAAELLREADFLSIGSNDLAQYVLAMDRGHPELAARLDGLHPAVLRLIGMAAEAARAAQKKLSLCGGLGADPQALPILLGLGVGELSVVTGAIPRLKAQVRRLQMIECVDLARRALALGSAGEVRELVRHWQAQSVMPTAIRESAG